MKLSKIDNENQELFKYLYNAKPSLSRKEWIQHNEVY